MTADHESNAAGGEPELSDSLRTFGAVLKALREAAGLTQEDFAPRVRYSPAYIAKIEQGRRFPPENLPERAAEALGAVAGKVLGAAARSLRRRAGLASWFQQWAGIEEEAITLYAYECRGFLGCCSPRATSGPCSNASCRLSPRHRSNDRSRLGLSVSGS